MNELTISVIIPAFNEEDYIANTIQAILTWTYNTEIIVVDDGSTDKTREIVYNMLNSYENINLISLEKNSGKGNALMKGIKQTRGKIVMFLDADLGESAKEAIRLIHPIINDEKDMTIAILPSSKTKAGFGLVKNLARQGIYYFTGFQSKAPLSGQRAVKKEYIDQIVEFANGFGIEVGLTIDGIQNGWRVGEFDVPLRHRESKRDFNGFIHRGKEFIDVSKALIMRRRRIQL